MRTTWALGSAFVLSAGTAGGQEPSSSPAPSATEAAEAGLDSASEKRPEPLTGRCFFWSVEGGYGYQNLYGVSMNGVDLDATLGCNRGTYSYGALIETLPGLTEYGLKTLTLDIGPFVEAHFERLRFGGGVRVGMLAVFRATRDDYLSSASAGAYVRGSVDIVALDEPRGAAVFLVAKASVDAVGGALYGATAGVGLRY